MEAHLLTRNPGYIDGNRMTCTVFFYPRARLLSVAADRTSTSSRTLTPGFPKPNPSVKPVLRTRGKSTLTNPSRNAEIVTCMGINFKAVNLPSTPSAGQIQFCAHNWMQITGDPWILEVVKGYKLELDYKPVQHKPPPPLIMNKRDIALTQTEIENMVTKGAIVPVAPCNAQFLSQMFLVPK